MPEHPEIDSSSSPQQAAVAAQSYKLLVTSSIVFFLASLFYLIAAVLDYVENEKPAQEQGTSMSWILIVLGGFGFMVLGGLDYYNTKKKIHIIMFLAGFFAMIAAIVTDTNVKASVWLQLVSNHLFFLESIQWIIGHFRVGAKLETNDSRRGSLLFAETGDFCFFLGAFMDVCISYYLVSKSISQTSLVANQSTTTSGVEIASSFFWLIASLVSMTVTCRLGKQGFAGAAGSGGGPSQLTTNTSATMT